MRRLINKLSKIGKIKGLASQVNQSNKRLAAALEQGPIRPIESYYVFGIATYNPRTEQSRIIEIRHDVGNGTNRYNIYLDGKKLGRQWSRSWFVSWLFDRIDPVLSSWE